MPDELEGVRTNTLLMLLGDLAHANEDMAESDVEPYEWRLSRKVLMREINRWTKWAKCHG
jgi:hypothetical protein